MNDYSLDVSIGETDFKHLNGSYFAIQKQIHSAGGTLVQWICQPVQSKEFTISWKEEYGVYFTNTQIREGALVEVKYSTPAQLGFKYVITIYYTKVNNISLFIYSYLFENDAFTQCGYGEPGTINIESHAGGNCNFGILQENCCSKASPLVVTMVLNRGNVTFCPTTRVLMYFTKSCIGVSIISLLFSISSYSFLIPFILDGNNY